MENHKNELIGGIQIHILEKVKKIKISKKRKFSKFQAWNGSHTTDHTKNWECKKWKFSPNCRMSIKITSSELNAIICDVTAFMIPFPILKLNLIRTRHSQCKWEDINACKPRHFSLSTNADIVCSGLSELCTE